MGLLVCQGKFYTARGEQFTPRKFYTPKILLDILENLC